MAAEIGEVIRKIRKGKGILQKELYKDIVSITFAIQFEKGIHSINAESFLQLLKRLDMNSDEFNQLHHKFSHDALKELIYQMIDAINGDNRYELETTLKKLDRFTYHPHYRLAKAFAILTNLLPFLPYSMLKVHLPKIEKKLLTLNQLNLLCYFYLNFIDCSLTAADFQTAKRLSISLGEIAKDPEFLFFKLLSGIYLDLIEAALVFNEETLKKIKQNSRSLDQLTNFNVSKQLEKHIQDIEDRSQKHK